MRRQSPLPFAVFAAAFVLLAGCRPQEPFYFHQSKDPTLTHYQGVATQIDIPLVDSDTLPDVKAATKPFSINDKQPKETWEIKLEKVIEIALENNKIIRSIGGQVSPQAPIGNILRNPDGVASVYDPALIESNPRPAPKPRSRPSTRSSRPTCFGRRSIRRKTPRARFKRRCSKATTRTSWRSCRRSTPRAEPQRSATTCSTRCRINCSRRIPATGTSTWKSKPASRCCAGPACSTTASRGQAHSRGNTPA